MRRAIKAAPSDCRILFLSVFFASLSLSLVVAQKTPKPSLPKYDFQTEAKINGIIEEVKLSTKGGKEIVHLLLKNGPETMDVYLCPKSFMDEMSMYFNKETRSKVKQGETDLVPAREVVQGNNTFLLRDAKGDPVWN